MTLHEIMYGYEHQMLPTMFFKHKNGFVGMIIDKPKILYDIVDDIFKSEETENPYSEEDFRIDTAKLDDDLFMLKLDFPKPETVPLCYCCYMFFDGNFTKTGYYCVEKGKNILTGEEQSFLCAWDEDERHHNYGLGTFDDKKNFLNLLKIHIERFYRKGKK